MDYYTKIKNLINREGVSNVVKELIINPGYDSTPCYKVYLKNNDILIFAFKNRGWIFDNGIFHMRIISHKTDQTLMIDDYYQKKDIREFIVDLHNDFIKNLFD